MSSVLTIDIGNTTISFGLFKGKKLILSFKVSTGKRSFYRSGIVGAMNKGRIRDISKIVLCSVVPKETTILKSMLRSMFKKDILEVGSDIKIPIKNRYNNPKQVGMDRLVNAYAGLNKFGPGLILVDFGTAITFDVVSKKGEYLGGLIFPGLDLSLDALKNRTALLPRITLRTPKALIGKDTISCINNGIIFGMAGVCDGVIERLQRKFKGYKVIATGGNVSFIKKFSKKMKIVQPQLTLEGLRLLANQ